MVFDYDHGLSPYGDPAELPCCGVLALSKFCRVDFGKVWTVIAAMHKRPNAWKGRTTIKQRDLAMKALGVRGSRNTMIYPVPIHTFADKHTIAGKRYILEVSGHVLYLDSWHILHDQHMVAHVNYHQARRRRVISYVMEIG